MLPTGPAASARMLIGDPLDRLLRSAPSTSGATSAPLPALTTVNAVTLGAAVPSAGNRICPRPLNVPLLVAPPGGAPHGTAADTTFPTATSLPSAAPLVSPDESLLASWAER